MITRYWISASMGGHNCAEVDVEPDAEGDWVRYQDIEHLLHDETQVVGPCDVVSLRCKCRTFERQVLSLMGDETRFDIEQFMAEHIRTVELYIPMPQAVSEMTVQCPICKTSGRYVRNEPTPEKI